MPMESRTVHFSNVSFGYQRRPFPAGTRPLVFDNFSWQIPAGCSVLLGPNGAGKTTLLALAATALAPDRGALGYGELTAGRRADRTAIRRRIGWMPQQVRAIPGLTAREQVAYAGWLKGMSRSDAWHEAANALDRVGLSVDGNRLTSELSGGQRHRVGLAQLLVHDSELLLLDEPTAGLDPAQRARFRDLTREIGDARTVLVSTHQVDDLDDLFEAAIVLDRGRIVFQGSVPAFLALAPASSPFPAEAAYATLIPDQS